ncbi:MAG: four helix bundle protein [Candidatus Margulisiibacteriota bacterium]
MEIQERALEFGVRIIKFVEKLPRTTAGNVVVKQLMRAGTSIGANLEEADGAASKKDFINKVVIARKEARETRYWLKLIEKAELINNAGNKKELKELTQESYELMKITSAIINKAREKKVSYAEQKI